MNHNTMITRMLGALACAVLCSSPLAAAETYDARIAGEIDWPAFMRQHDMTFDKLPANWKEAPHFGNAMVGSMLYATGGKIKLQLFRADVQDHRDDIYGWTGYSRAHLMIGDFHLETVGKLTGGNWRKDLWNAELTGVITTDKGEIRIRHYTYAEDMAIVTEDDDMLREKLYPLLRRSINLYLHMVEEGADGKLHLPPTYSPELGSFTDCNFDLALFKWGCHTLLHASKRLKIDDPLIPRWKEVTKRLVDYPANENGFMVGDKVDYPVGYRHLGSFLMIYPLYLVNIDQEGARELIAKSYSRVNVPGKMKLPAMIQSHAAPIAAALGCGDDALAGLKALQGNLFPNGMWFDKPCLESSLSMANIVQNMLIQSWSDPAKDAAGPIRIFPAVPSEWQDIEFRDLRAEGAFLVSARRERGNTTWVRIKSLAGEPCRIEVDMHNPQVQGSRSHIVKQLTASMFELDLKKNEEVLLMSEKAP